MPGSPYNANCGFSQNDLIEHSGTSISQDMAESHLTTDNQGTHRRAASEDSTQRPPRIHNGGAGGGGRLSG